MKLWLVGSEDCALSAVLDLSKFDAGVPSVHPY